VKEILVCAKTKDFLMSSSHQKNLILWAGEDEEFILKGNRELKAGWWGPEARTLTTASSKMVSCA
jgi:hypothetical protein